MPASHLPRIETVGSAVIAPRAVALVLHGGRDASRESSERRGLAYLRMLPVARMLARGGVAVYLLRYRYRGWNAPTKDAELDARWALGDIARRWPGVPVVLVGHSMGGRAALGAAGADNVVAVCALAPWVEWSDPVAQLAGRTVLIVHGDRDRWTDPGSSFAYALRAKGVTDRVARFELAWSGHFMFVRVGAWHSLVRRFVQAASGSTPEDPAIADAMQQPAPCGLRVRPRRAARRRPRPTTPG